MSTYELDDLIQRWKRGALTVEQAIGQILLMLQIIEERLLDLERQLARLMEQCV